MRAVQIDRFGGPEVLRVADVAVPAPGAGEVRVRVLTAGVNPIDHKIRDGSSGVVKNVGPGDFPLTLGRECCGVVEEVGPGADLVVGQRVFGMVPMTWVGGCHADRVVLPAEALALVPDGVDATVAGGTALAGLTAWSAVYERARVTAGDVVLVHGGGGGVGQVVVQLAVEAGATVYATASGRHRERIEAMGATHVDYTREDFRQVTPRPSVIVDGVYFGTYAPSLDHLTDGGRLVVLPTLADLGPARARGIDVSLPLLRPSRERLDELAARVLDGRLRVEVGATFALDDVADAHRLVEGGHANGKVVLTVAGA